ncbi:MAG: hypothetical protein ACRDLE_02950 [Gaiellaceae bacterium]
MSDYLDVAVRAYPNRTAKKRRGRLADPPAELLVVLDTETTVDAAQRLLFGSYRMYAVGPKGTGCELHCVEEGLIHADDLEERDPLGLEVLRAYALREPPAVDRNLSDAAWSLRLRSAREFNEKIVRRVVFEGRARLVCFNFPFDLSRLARGWGETKREPGEFWLSLCDYERGGRFHENRYAPRLGIRTIDSKRALLRFRSPRATERVDRIPEGSKSGRARTGYVFEGRLLDLRALGFALTGQGHSLESACEAFDIAFKKHEVDHGRITDAYIAYNRDDVAATAALYTRAIEEYGRHPVDLRPERCYSPASLGKAYLRAFGIRPPRERHAEITPELLGFAASAYYGGRAECRIRRTPLPVITCDFLSMYPTVCTLLRLWPLLTCNRIEAVEVPPEEMQAWLERTSLDDCFDPATWGDLAALVLIKPAGDLLPVRARYDDTNLGIGLNPLVRSPELLWYTLADALAARQLGGKTPTIVRAIRFKPKGRARTLRPLRLRGNLAIDPRADDFFRAVIEERQQLNRGSERSDQERKRLDRFLKVTANATSYGIFAEINRQELPASRRVATDAFGLEPFACFESSPETPGEFYFSPFAALIAGGARLMLALLERLVSDLEA